MARAGYCSQCGRYVWLAPDGGCTHGHPAEAVSQVYDAASSSDSPFTSARAKALIVVAVLVVAGVAVTGVVVAGRAVRQQVSAASSKPKRFDLTNWHELDAHGDKYRGTPVDAYAVAQLDGTSQDGYTLVPVTVSADDDYSAVLRLPARSGIHKGDGLHFGGVVAGNLSYKGDDGAPHHSTQVVVRRLTKVDAGRPLRSVRLGQSQTEVGVTVSVDSVEYDIDGTRVRLVVKNGTDHAIEFWGTDEDELRQGKLSAKPFQDDEDKYRPVAETITPGVTSTGTLSFDPVFPEKDAEIVIGIAMDDTKDKFERMHFAVPGGVVTAAEERLVP